MRQRYDQCSCSVECPLRFKVNICQKTELIEVYHERNVEIGRVSKGKDVQNEKPEKGVVKIVKNLIEKMCEDHSDETPKRILSKLIKNRKEKNLFNQ